MNDTSDHPYTPECPHCQLQRALPGFSNSKLPPVGSAPFAIGEEMLFGGRYALEQQLSMGGTGVVYRARDRQTNTDVAVKVLHWWDDDPTTLHRFRLEAELVRRVAHPNIVRVLDFGQTNDGDYYIVLELLEGEDLGTLLRRERRIDDVDVFLDMIGQCASALASVHAQNIVHRDLKPMNVFVCGTARQPLIKLLDFGMSKLLDDAECVTSNHTIIGAMGYMSPEQALGRSSEVNMRADVYALGALAYRMLTGRPPFQASNLSELTQQVVKSIPRPPSELRAMPPQVDTALLRALSKQPDKRPATAVELSNQLKAAFAASA